MKQPIQSGSPVYLLICSFWSERSAVTLYRYSPYPALVAPWLPALPWGRQPTSCCKMSATVSHEIAVLVVAPTSKTLKSRATTSLVLRLVGPLSRGLSLARLPVPIKPVNLSMFPT